jgi:hypothetical protein
MAIGLMAALTPQAALFFVQSTFILRGELVAVLELAKYAGLLSLVFYLFDGNSGLVYSIARNRFSDRVLAQSFFLYRLTVIAVFAVAALAATFYVGEQVLILLPYLTVSILFRLPWLDGPLDQRGKQALALALGSGWMLVLCALGLLDTRVDAHAAGIAAVIGSLIMALVRLLLASPGEILAAFPIRTHARRTAVFLIWQYLATFGMGQIYGRAILFAVASTFSGPVPALVLYAKQVFNAGGFAVAYVRRDEASQGHGAPFQLADLRRSVLMQAGLALPCGLIVIAAGASANVAIGAIAAIISWQVLERLFSNASYALQHWPPSHSFSCSVARDMRSVLQRDQSGPSSAERRSPFSYPSQSCYAIC